MKNLMKRSAAALLALIMCVGMLNLTAFAADVGDKCPKCETGTIVQAKDNPKHLICTDCAEFSEYIQDECKHEKTYSKESGNADTHNLYCISCEKLVGTAKHNFVNGKCDCGAQEPEHVHDYKNVTVFCGTFVHQLKCSCGDTKTEYNTGKPDYDLSKGGNIVQCDYCGYWEPVEDVHNWGEWEPNNNDTHTAKCTDAGCEKTRTEDCKLEAFDDGEVSGVKCSVCGWIKYDDGTSGSDESKFCKDDKHEFGNLYQHNEGYH